MKKAVRILFILILFSILSSSSIFASAALAPTTQNIQDSLTSYDTNGSVHLGITTWGTQNYSVAWLACFIGDKAVCPKCETGKTCYYDSNVLNGTTKSIAALYQNRPADTMMYLADLGQRAGVVKPAYAQGIGFSGLSPILNIWKAFRNVAYGFLIIVMVIIGFMVLFRMKIDPRTVISVQSAIPRVIITLILITFSYAIVGLMIDLMYLAIFLITAVINSAMPFQNPSLAYTNATGGPLHNLWGAVMAPGTPAAEDLVIILSGSLGASATTVNAIGDLVMAIAGLILGGGIGIGGAFGAAIGGGIGIFGGGGANVLVRLIVWLALAFTFIRILFMLVNAYINILLSVIFGPLQLMVGAIPNTDAFGSWFRNLIANLVVFPITSGMLILGTILTSVAAKNPNLWAPPGVASQGLQAGAAGIIGLGMCFVIPTIANTIKESLKAKPLMPTGTGAVFSPITSVYGTAMGGVSQMYYLSQLTGEHGLIKQLFGGGKK